MGVEPEDSLRECSKCHKPKPLTEFHVNGPGKWRPDCKDCVRVRVRKAYDPVKSRVRQAGKYGLTLDQAEMFWGAGKCEICGSNDPRHPTGSFSIDHCHVSSKVRGALCSDCNLGLGKFHDDPILLRKAADYVERHA